MNATQKNLVIAAVEATVAQEASRQTLLKIASRIDARSEFERQEKLKLEQRIQELTIAVEVSKQDIETFSSEISRTKSKMFWMLSIMNRRVVRNLGIRLIEATDRNSFSTRSLKMAKEKLRREF